jgi:gamma-glutamylputrescine oxidase
MLAPEKPSLLKPAPRAARPGLPQDHRTYFDATTAELPRRPALAGARLCDVCVVGAGYAGLSTALHLAERGYDVVVLEAGRVGAGASGRNSGFVLPGYAAEIDELCALVGADHAERLWRLSLDGVALVKALVTRHAIACDLTNGVLTAAAAPADVAVLDAQATLMRSYGYAQARPLSQAETRAIVDSPNYFGGLLDEGAFHLHPLAFVRGIARAALAEGVAIFEDSAALRVEPGTRPRVVTARGMVEASHVVLAANAALGPLAPEIARRIVPVTAVLGATEKLGAERARGVLRRNVAVYDTQPALDYYRLTPDHRLIFGCAARFVRPSARQSAAWLERNVARVFPQLASVRMEYVWRGQVDLTLNRLPDIGRRDGGVWYAQGFNGHGVALSILTGRAIADAIAGHPEDFALLTDLPYRPWPLGNALARAALPVVRGMRQLRHALTA